MSITSHQSAEKPVARGYTAGMADINIENFYRHIAKSLHMLYTHFPTRAALYVDEVAGVDEPDEYGLHSPTYTAGFFAMLWLADEGFISYSDTIRQDGIDQAYLTHRGFLILTQITDELIVELVEAPDSGGNVINLQPTEDMSPSLKEERMLVINQLRAALNSGSSIAVKKVVNHILRA
ncbi:MAG: hypothetical protein ACJAYE_000387 [Candidatus Azotimanducaceae bacterium]|jgi:hypothetical protein